MQKPGARNASPALIDFPAQAGVKKRLHSGQKRCAIFLPTIFGTWN
jgi:hypothetical protein